MTDIQFGVNARTASSLGEFRRLVRRADDLGFDVVAAPDHLGGLAPFSALAVAGTVSGRLRLRTYVLNTGFWNPALLAREVATLDVLSDGRAELGLGAGHAKGEHGDAGLPWLALDQRVEALQRTLLELRRRLADDDHRPRPFQRPVPVLVGAMSGAGLSVAARHADIVGFSGVRRTPGGGVTLSSAAETEQRVHDVRRWADGRPYRSDVLLQAVVVDREPAEAAADIVGRAPGLTVEQLLDSPFVLLAGDAARAAAELRRRRDLYGVDSVTTHQASMEALGAVIAAHRGAGA